MAVSLSTSELIVDGGRIEGRDLNLKSHSATDAEAFVLSIYGAVAYGHSEPSLTVEVKNSAQLSAARNARIETKAAGLRDVTT